MVSAYILIFKMNLIRLSYVYVKSVSVLIREQSLSFQDCSIFLWRNKCRPYAADQGSD